MIKQWPMENKALKGRSMKEITTREFFKIQNDDSVLLLDVRSKEEFIFANIGGINISLDQLENRLEELDQKLHIYCLCHHGVRSAFAVNILKQNGYQSVFNIKGGIDDWSKIIDSNVPVY